MIVGIGTDIFEVARMKRELFKNDSGLIPEVFTPSEINYCKSQNYPERHFAARFAAKEALFKALATGKIGNMSWKDIEIEKNETGAPQILLHGETEKFAKNAGVQRIFVSLSHADNWASANVILES
jgi:holo-[acyl-carrier protein] synthase